MRDKMLVVTTLLTAVTMLSIMTVGTKAFWYNGGGQDNNFEIFGPRIDRILIKMYGTLDAEIAALQAGEIDITDWPLTKPMIDTLSVDPNCVVLGYGGGRDYYYVDFNCNNNPYLGDPPDPAYPNPVYPNPVSVTSFRQALSHCIDNVALVTGPGQGLFDPMYTPIPNYMAFWVHPEIRPGGSLAYLTYPFDPTYATSSALLDEDGFPLSGGVRYWDMNANGVKDSGEDINLKVYNLPYAVCRGAGDQLQAGMLNLGIPFTRQEISPGQAEQIVMIDKDYHVYIGVHHDIGPDPDYLYDFYHPDNYWHPGDPPNFGHIGFDNPAMQVDLKEGLKYAVDVPTALASVLDFQVLFAENAYEKPLASTSAPKAFHKTYVGGTPDETTYAGDPWTDLVNEMGQGEDSWWSTLNMYPVGHPWGDGTRMTVRYGWSTSSMPVKVNPLYSTAYWEWAIVDRVYDSLARRNPYTLGPFQVPQLAETWTVGTWVDPADGVTKSAITVTLRPDVLWNNGVPLTIDDVIYTFLQAPGQLAAVGASPPWWQPAVDQIAGFYKLDQYSATFLMKANTFLASSWILNVPIIPKGFWQPFIASNTAAVIMGDLGPGQVGTGPFLYDSITPGSTATLVRNPTYYSDSVVDPVTEATMGNIVRGVAWMGSPQISPIKVGDPGTGSASVHITVKLANHGKTAAAGVTYSVKLTNLITAAQTTLASGNGQAIAAGAAFTAYDATETVAKGKYSVDVVISATYQGVTFGDEYRKTVYVTVQGDINEDGVVDIIDIVIVAGAFGSMQGQPNYRPQSDVNHDGVVDILDIVKTAGVYGWTYLP